MSRAFIYTCIAPMVGARTIFRLLLKPGSGVGETICLNKNYMFLNKNLQASDLPVDRFG